MKKSIKLSLLFMLILAVVISFFGCGNSTASNSSRHKKMSDSEIEKNFKMKRIEGGYSIEEYIGESENVYIPSEYKGYKIKKIEGNSFQNKEFIEKIAVPSSVETIGYYAFACKNLKSVELNEGLKKIGTSAFSGTSLDSVVIPGSVEEIGERAFSWCKNLKKVDLNEGLKSIGDGAFSNTNIRQIIIPKSVINMGNAICYCCMELNGIYCRTNRKPDEWHKDWDARSYIDHGFDWELGGSKMTVLKHNNIRWGYEF